MKRPLVSIITPTYNCARYLTETVDSVINQDYEDIDYLVIDDCSTDNTLEVLSRFDEFIPVLHFAENQGEQVAVNEGLARVAGKYFMIVNADDPLLPGAVSKLVEFMESHPDVLCGYPDWDSIDEEGKFRSHVQSREYDFKFMVKHHTWLPSVGSIFRADIIQTVGLRDTSFRWLGDADFWLRVGLAGPMARVPYTLATWRNREGQASKSKSSERAKEHVRVMQKFFSGNVNGLSQFEDEAMCWASMVAAVVTDNKLDSALLFGDALMYHPQILINPAFYDTAAKRLMYLIRR